MSEIEGPIPTNQSSTSAGTASGGGAILRREDLPSGSQTQVIEATEIRGASGGPTLKLRLKDSDDGDDASNKGEKQKPKKALRKQVSWTQETIDNENLGRKKSKCCCVYVKPKSFGESDTESEDDEKHDDCEHCVGHTPSGPKGSRS